MAARILVVEDDEKIGSFVGNGLKQSGFKIDQVKDGYTAYDYLMIVDYAAAVIDLMLPGLDGFTLIKKIRCERLNLPILIISSRTQVEDRVYGLDIGADDYLIKPFAFSELLARVQALMRRGIPLETKKELSCGQVEVDLSRRKVYRNQQLIDVPPGEFELLVYLMENAGRVVSKTMIMENVWDFNFDPQTNVVEARVCRLREKVDRPFDSSYIKTIRGFGYTFEVPEPLVR